MNKMKRVLSVFLLLLVPLLVYGQTDSRHDVQVGRYSSVPAEPLPEQINLLDAMVTMNFPKRHVKTVGDAVHHLLDQSGYRLADTYASDPAVQILLTRPLPEVQRHLGPCPLHDALTTLAGPVFRLVLDPLHRLVSFEVSEKYRALTPASFSPVSAETASALRYGPVKHNETVGEIAGKLRRDPSASLEQMMLAILAVNPYAFGFVGGQANLNYLHVGAVLEVPPANAWRRWSRKQAKHEVMRHYRRWQRRSQ